MDRLRLQSLATVEFTYDWYRAFLDALQDDGLQFRTFADQLVDGDAVLRHDVDLSLEKALTMARIEAERGIQATYCVLLTSALYNPLERERREQLRAIAALGHDVALHFSTHEYWDSENPPSSADLVARVDEEREILGTVLPTVPGTVSFHVPPPWVLGESYDGFRNAYGPSYFTEIEYVADSGQRWREQPPDLDPETPVQILTHPGLWGETDADFETRVDWSVSEACRRSDRKAQLEFIQGAYSQ